MAAPTLSVGLGRFRIENGYELEVTSGMRPVLKTHAEEAEAIATRLVPVDEDVLRPSIKGEVVLDETAGVYGFEVSADRGDPAPVEAFVEYGTGRRGKQTTNVGLSAAEARATNLTTYIHGPSAGMVAQPYLRPAFLSVLKRHYGFGR